MNKARQGFSLVEVLIVIMILIVLMTIMVMVINPIAMMEKATDARMKKDLGRIRVAFEEYRSDKKGFPDALLAAELMDKDNCGTDVFAPWLTSWPCDPRGNPYQILVEGGDTPQWFKVVTKLDNEDDQDIPDQIRQMEEQNSGGTAFNYGVSSTNVLWYDRFGCNLAYDGVTGELQCYVGVPSACGHVGSNCARGEMCNVSRDCSVFCRVECCGSGCN